MEISVPADRFWMALSKMTGGSVTYSAESFYILLKKKTDTNSPTPHPPPPKSVFNSSLQKNIKFGDSNSRSNFQICYLRRNELFTQNNMTPGGPNNRGFEKMLLKMKVLIKQKNAS